STVVSSCSTVLSDQSADSRVTVYLPEMEDEEVPPDCKLPSIQAYIYGQHENPPSLSGASSDGSTASMCSEEHSAMSVMSEYEDDEKENRGEERLEREGGRKEKAYAQVSRGDYNLDEILDDDRPLFSDVEEEDGLSKLSRFLSYIQEYVEKDCFGYEFERLSEADFNSLMRRREEASSSTTSGGGVQLIMQQPAAACRSAGGCTCGAAAAAVGVEKATEKPHRASSVRRTLSKAFRAIGESHFLLSWKPSVLSSSCASASACISPPIVPPDSNRTEMEGGRASPFEMEKQMKMMSCSPQPIKAAKMVHPHSRSASTLMNPFVGERLDLPPSSTPILNRSSSGFSSMSSRTPPFPQGTKIRRSFRVEVSSPMSRSLHIPSTTSSPSPLYADVFASKHAFYRNHSLEEEDEGSILGGGVNGSVAALMRDFDYDDVKSVVSSASTSRLGLEGGGRGGGSRRHYRVRTANDMRNFLRSPVRLRRRDKAAAQQEAIEAGFEPAPNVARCHSLHSLAYTKSQFTPSIDLNESLRNVGIDYTPSGAGHAYKRDSYVSVGPAPPPHRPLDLHSNSSHSPSKPIPIDGVIGSAGYHRSRVQLRDSASASPHSFTNRRSFQQLNTSDYANLGGSFHEFPLATSGGGETRKPPIPQRSSIVSESTVSTSSPVVMRQHASPYNATPLSGYILKYFYLSDNSSVSLHFANLHSISSLSPSVQSEMRLRPLGDDLFTVSDGEEMERREEGRRRRRRRKEREMEGYGDIYENLEWIKMNHKTNARRGLEMHNGYGGGREHKFSVAAPTYYEEMHHQQRMHVSEGEKEK
ncbi:hypothetical protein PENTCL1PPCAC_2681, partial [Pristionchus entomophagus]